MKIRLQLIIMLLSTLLIVASCSESSVDPPATPSIPELQSPGDEVKSLPTDLTFKWLASEDAKNYIIQISTDSDFNSYVKNETVTETEFYTNDLTPFTKYFWRVKAKNGSAESEWSETFYLITKASGPILELVSNDEEVTGSTFNDVLYSYQTVKNLTDTDVYVHGKIEVVSMTFGQEVSICLGGMCYPPVTTDYIAPNGMKVSANSESNFGDLTLDYYPRQMPGEGYFKITLIPEDDPENTLSYNIKFTVSF